MRRVTLSLTLGILVLLTVAMPASAGRRWCAKDPIVSINGTPVQIWVAVPEEYQSYVNDAIKVKIKVPKHLKRDVLFTDEGFNGHGEEVEWKDLKDERPGDGIVPMELEITVKFDEKRMEAEFGKDALEAALGDDKDVPVEVTVNIGEITTSYETHVTYGSAKKTTFAVMVTANDAVVK